MLPAKSLNSDLLSNIFLLISDQEARPCSTNSISRATCRFIHQFHLAGDGRNDTGGIADPVLCSLFIPFFYPLPVLLKKPGASSTAMQAMLSDVPDLRKQLRPFVINSNLIFSIHYYLSDCAFFPKFAPLIKSV